MRLERIIIRHLFLVAFIDMPEMLSYMRHNYDKWKELNVSRSADYIRSTILNIDNLT